MITFLIIIVVIIGIAILLNRYLNRPKQPLQEMVSDNLGNNLEVFMNMCPNCKTELLKDVKFCPNCGINLSILSMPAPSSKDIEPIRGNEKKGELIKNLLFGVVVIFLGVFVYNVITDKQKEKKNYEVKLMVIGDSKALISYTNSSGGIEQINGTELPWEVKYLCTGNNIFSISAQAQSYNSSIEVKIFVNGKEIKSSKSQGDFVVATANANISD